MNLSDLSKQDKTTKLNISFPTKKRAAQVGFKPMTYCIYVHVVPRFLPPSLPPSLSHSLTLSLSLSPSLPLSLSLSPLSYFHSTRHVHSEDSSQARRPVQWSHDLQGQTFHGGPPDPPLTTGDGFYRNCSPWHL